MISIILALGSLTLFAGEAPTIDQDIKINDAMKNLEVVKQKAAAAQKASDEKLNDFVEQSAHLRNFMKQSLNETRKVDALKNKLARLPQPQRLPDGSYTEKSPDAAELENEIKATNQKKVETDKLVNAANVQGGYAKSDYKKSLEALDAAMAESIAAEQKVYEARGQVEVSPYPTGLQVHSVIGYDKDGNPVPTVQLVGAGGNTLEKSQTDSVLNALQQGGFGSHQLGASQAGETTCVGGSGQCGRCNIRSQLEIMVNAAHDADNNCAGSK